MSRLTLSVVYVPREHFGCNGKALQSHRLHTPDDVEFILVDGASPAHARTEIEDFADERGALVVRTEHLLTPNEARNLGRAHAGGDLIIFIDNDVTVSRHWVESLVDCAQATDADVVGPVYLMGRDADVRIHLAGGEASILEERGLRRFHERHRYAGKRLADVHGELRRQPVETVEFHCMAVRRSVFDRIGPLDEQLLSTREHLDLCLAVREHGGLVWLEPDSVVTYLTEPPATRSDREYFLMRWSHAWGISSLQQFNRKWRITDDDHHQGTLKWLGKHRRLAFRRWQRPLRRWLGRSLTRRVIGLLDAVVARTVVSRMMADRARIKATVPPVVRRPATVPQAGGGAPLRTAPAP